MTTIVGNGPLKLRAPRGLSVSATGLIYIADTGNHRVVAVDSTGKLIYEVGGLGSKDGQFRWPRDIAAEFGTSVWVLDYGNRRLQRFSLSLEWQGSLDLESIAEQDELRPEEIALTPSGDLYLFDAEQSEILRLDVMGNVLLSSGGQSEFLASGRSYGVTLDQRIVWVDKATSKPRCADAALSPVVAFPGASVDSASCLWPQRDALYVLRSNALYLFPAAGGIDTLLLNNEIAAGATVDDRLAGDYQSSIYILCSVTGIVIRVRFH